MKVMPGVFSNFGNVGWMQPAVREDPIALKSSQFDFADPKATRDARTPVTSSIASPSNWAAPLPMPINTASLGQQVRSFPATFSSKTANGPASTFELESPDIIAKVSSCEKANCLALRTCFFPVIYSLSAPTSISWYLYTLRLRIRTNSPPDSWASSRANASSAPAFPVIADATCTGTGENA